MPSHHSPLGALKAMVERKRREIAQGKVRLPLKELESLVAQADPPRNLFAAIAQHPTQRHVSILAEIRRKGPLTGWIRPEFAAETFDPAAISVRLARNGASALACHTDGPAFGGRLESIAWIKDAVSLPVARRDFLVDPWQLWESRAAGADGVFLIAEALREGELIDLLILAQQLQMTAVVEVHTTESLLRVRPHIGFPHAAYSLLCINSLNWETMKSEASQAFRMLDLVENTSDVVCEVPVACKADIQRAASHGVRSVFVGESILGQADPGAALAAVLDRPVR